ncbi:MAG: glycosyltransferase family 39 protein, partial [Ktedonobacteraceae bacterium]|nr:glycosyltransferase family 39 protein [Ktedonobacteraceae bacterium]
MRAPEPSEPLIDPRASTSKPSRWWQWLALGGVMLVSLFMNFYQLGQNGFGNTYYAAGVRSMLDNWHNFFFVSFDPGGFVTLDKPPLGFWLQVVSARLFGFTAFSVYLPQALSGVLAVALLYWLVRRHFGVAAGLLAALALAVSPISVVTNRNNTIDSTLVLALLLGAWAVMRAAETGKLRWLLLCAVAVGLGFNIKTMAAYLVLPAFGLLYLLAAPRKIWTRIGHLALATVVLLLLSLSWITIVDLTPAAQRPYVGSTQDNSELSLTLGYNGIQRLLGHAIGKGGTINGGPNSGQQPPQNGGFPGSGNGGSNSQSSGSNPPAGGFGGGAFSGGGSASPLRLFNQTLGGQIAWLLPFALLGMVALAWQKRPRFPLEDREQLSLVLWGMWLLTMGIFFSVASFFHEYYLTEMAPAVGALFGIGAVVMWRDYRSAGWRGWLLPLAIAVTGATQIYILSSFPDWSKWLTPPIAVIGGIAVIVLVMARLIPRIKLSAKNFRYTSAAFCVAALALLIAPAVWAAIPMLNHSESQLPIAGPEQAASGLVLYISGPGGTERIDMPGSGQLSSAGGPGGMGMRGGEADQKLIQYLEKN